MLIKRKPSWYIGDAEATPEADYVNRRTLLKGVMGVAGTAALGMAGVGALMGSARSQTVRPSLTGRPVPAYSADKAGRAVTLEPVNITYNNFYEFGAHKRISDTADQQLKPRPWQIVIGGEVANPITLDVDELIGKMALEERVYRHRCVEAWSMVVPWVGFPLNKLVALAEPTTNAKYLRMETFGDPSMAQGIRSQPWYPWPYVEGLTMAEAGNDLPFLVVGAYGKVVANSMGAPIRLHLPWKYGFKSLKSIVKFTFTAERPIGFWEQISRQSNNDEYGFWANVNPEVPHPRWSQASEEVLGTGERVPTQIYNGYAEQVASLYTGVTGQQLYR